MLGACSPSCEQTCRKLLNCGNLDSQRVSLQECQASCNSQLRLFDGWQDEDELDQAFRDHRTCLMRSSCEEIDLGECYDERLFQLDPTSPLDTGAAPNPVTGSDTGL